MKGRQISLSDIARACGVSKTTVSDALRNRSRVNKATRERVLRAAARLGYAPDARIASLMEGVRKTVSKDLLPIVWLNTGDDEDAWRKLKFLTPYLEGASVRAHELGYRIEEIWLGEPGMTMPRLSRILRHRGIEGVIVTHHQMHLPFDCDHLAAVSLEGHLLWPRLHQVKGDFFYNILLALKMLVRNGYRRIGVCLSEYCDRGFGHATRAAIYYFQATQSKGEPIPPCYYHGWSDAEWRGAKRQIAGWMSRYKPDAVVCLTNQFLDLMEEIGYRVPEDVGVIHLATDDDVSDWAGVTSHKRKIGAMASEMVVSLIRNRQFGVPDTTWSTVVRGSWHPGRTLLMPKPR